MQESECAVCVIQTSKWSKLCEQGWASAAGANRVERRYSGYPGIRRYGMVPGITKFVPYLCDKRLGKRFANLYPCLHLQNILSSTRAQKCSSSLIVLE